MIVVTIQNARVQIEPPMNGNALEQQKETTMLRKYNKTLTVALTAIALATASLAATSDAFAGGGGTCWLWVRGTLVNICY